MSQEIIYGVALTFVPILISLIVHEFAHARTALAFGDPTAKLFGRCTLNPSAHLDPLGTLMMVLVGFGWAKPVPFNANNLHPRRLGKICVSAAGPVSNLSLAATCAIALRILTAANLKVEVNGPFQPMDMVFFILTYGLIINLNLAVFNLIPLFPLDGHHISREALPAASREGFMRWQVQYGQWAFMALWIGPVVLRRLANIDFSPLGWYLTSVTVPAMEVLLGSAIGPAISAFLKFKDYMLWELIMSATNTPATKRVLSGVQPSGRLHLGNYLGAIRQHLLLQEQGNECFYFIANYHAMTSLQDKVQLEEATMHVAMAYLALGLDPQRSVFFVQSDVPEVTELCWMLNTVCPVSQMQKATTYKDKVAHGLSPNMGLFDYPVLQAADIVIYDSLLVPVGQDQKQHIEITRDLAGRFNQTYGREVLVLPEAYIVPEVAIVPGLDGQKMSKSYNNTIEIFATAKQTSKPCAQIVTDSTPLEAPKNPERDNVFALLKLLASPPEVEEIAAKYRAGGYGYGHAKGRLAELVNELFAPARERYAELETNPAAVRDVLADGGRRARQVAKATMQRVRDAAGILVHK